MIGLVRAIKFANPDASIRQVHKEIIEVLSQKDQYDFLANISLNDVKKVWKKAMMTQQQQQQQPQNQQSSTIQIPQTTGSNEEPTLHLYTIGNGSIPFLAQEYSQAKAREAAAAAAVAANETIAEDGEEKTSTTSLHNSSHMFPVFLNVPADRSGHRPYQAIVNFTENYGSAKATTNNTTTASSSSRNTSTKQKRHDIARKNKNHKITAEERKQQNHSPIICKIQVAASSEQTAAKYPMLLYNQDRTIKTFIHPEDDTEKDADNGYNRIHNLVTCHGVGGALGISGGSKAYFYAYLLGNDILNIDTSQLADVPTIW
jgi:hypothetical protein